MSVKLNKVLNEVLQEISPSAETTQYMSDELKIFLVSLNKRLKKLKINATPFVGGSFAKGTIIKGNTYDIDLFLRFDNKYKDQDLSKLTKKILRKTKNTTKVHGSRDYYQVKISPWFKIEVVPTRKVKIPKNAENITDLSYSHVKYIKSKIKSKKILDEIKLGKGFCKAQGVYGAESYVHGFSGHSIELLIYYYKTFEKFLKEISKKRKEKLIIDIEKLYKNKNEILIEMNGSKLMSPIVLIDPTFKERNAIAALSDEVLDKFKLIAKQFLESPSIEYFHPKRIDLDEIKGNAKKNNLEFVLISTKTKKQEGDIAGTKLLKFHKHMTREAARYFNVKDSGFKYLEKKEGKSYFVLERKKEILFPGPLEKDKKNIIKFKAEHKKTYVKNGRLYAIEKNDLTIRQFLVKWKKKNKKRIKQMYVSKIKII